MRLSDLKDHRVGIWGFGREGRAALDALTSRSIAAQITVYTPQPQTGVSERQRSLARFVSGTDAPHALGDCEVVLRSPGISIYRPEVAELLRKGVTLSTGTNLWFAEVGNNVPVIAITGTKGKSTTASLAAHLARTGAVDVHLAGNVGKPLLALLDETPASLYIVELSSYQIADLEAPPTVGVVLNLFREHLDWHQSEVQYYEDKLRILSLADQVVPVLNARDPRLRAWAEDRVGTRWFGDGRGTHVHSGHFIAADGRELAPLSELQLAGEHNALNACAAFEALDAVAALDGDLAARLRTFRPLPHRLEVVARASRHLWINDSISTTPESTIAATRSFSGRHVTVIVGGFDRGQRHHELAAVLVNHRPSAAVVALPQTGYRLIEALAETRGGPTIPAHIAAGLGEGVALALRLTPRGGVVLLSPAAPSYGSYRDFEERGEHFRRLVRTTLAESVS